METTHEPKTIFLYDSHRPKNRQPNRAGIPNTDLLTGSFVSVGTMSFSLFYLQNSAQKLSSINARWDNEETNEGVKPHRLFS